MRTRFGARKAVESVSHDVAAVIGEPQLCKSYGKNIMRYRKNESCWHEQKAIKATLARLKCLLSSSWETVGCRI